MNQNSGRYCKHAREISLLVCWPRKNEHLFSSIDTSRTNYVRLTRQENICSSEHLFTWISVHLYICSAWKSDIFWHWTFVQHVNLFSIKIGQLLDHQLVGWTRVWTFVQLWIFVQHVHFWKWESDNNWINLNSQSDRKVMRNLSKICQILKMKRSNNWIWIFVQHEHLFSMKGGQIYQMRDSIHIRKKKSWKKLSKKCKAPILRF